MRKWWWHLFGQMELMGDLWSSWELSKPGQADPTRQWPWPFHQGARCFLESTNTRGSYLPSHQQDYPNTPPAAATQSGGLRSCSWGMTCECTGLTHHPSSHHTTPAPVWHPQPSQSGKLHPMPSPLQRFQKLVTERREGRQWRFPEGTSNKIWAVSPRGHNSSDCPWVSTEWSRMKSTSANPPLTCPPSTLYKELP